MFRRWLFGLQPDYHSTRRPGEKHFHMSLPYISVQADAFGLCNAPGIFQRCIMAIFSDMVEKTIEVFMDDFLVLGKSFDNCLENLRGTLCSDPRARLDPIDESEPKPQGRPVEVIN